MGSRRIRRKEDGDAVDDPQASRRIRKTAPRKRVISRLRAGTDCDYHADDGRTGGATLSPCDSRMKRGPGHAGIESVHVVGSIA